VILPKIDITLIPNPAISGQTTLVWDPESVPFGKHDMRLTDATGKLVYADSIEGSAGRLPLSLDASGLLWVEVQWNDGRISRGRLLLHK
jgi:hypothetical protein